MLVAAALSPFVVNLKVSEERYAPPVAARNAPPVAAELSQPNPEKTGGFPQGHATTPPTPGAHVLVKLVPPKRSRRKAASSSRSSSRVSLSDPLVKATNRPSGVITGKYPF